MINTDGKPTIANWPLKNGGRDVEVTPPSEEGKTLSQQVAADFVMPQLEGRSLGELMTERERNAEVDRAAVSDDVAADFGEINGCYMVIGIYMNGDEEEGRFSETYEVQSAERAEQMAMEGKPGVGGVGPDSGLVIAAVVDTENSRVVA